MTSLIDHLRRAVLRDGAGPGDGDLLGRFIERHDEAALAALIHRHGPMVWGVCRRLLTHHDAEDAFQATFLVLVRKAASILPRAMVGNWLYGVAHQTALQAQRTAARRRAREVQVTPMPDTEAEGQSQWSEVQPVLDEELSRLPDIYRAVVVLCDLEGRTRKEAARQLGVPEGTVGGRLARARVLLARRLAQRGIVLSGGALAALLAACSAPASASPALMASTIKAASLLAAGRAAGVISVRVAALTEGVVKAMFVTRFRNVLAVGTMVMALCCAAGVMCLTQAAEPPNGQEVKRSGKVDRPADKEDQKARPDEVLLQGSWKAVELIDGGEKSAVGGDRSMSIAFAGKDSCFTVTDRRHSIGLEMKCAFVCRLNPNASPKAIDMAFWKPGSEDKAQFCEGIYSLEGDTLTICLHNDAFNVQAEKAARPAGFDTAKAPGAQVVIYKRVK